MTTPLPTYTAQEQVQPAPVADTGAVWTTIGKGFGTVEKMAVNAHENQLEAEKQIAANQLSTRSEQIRTEAALKFQDPSQQNAFYRQNYGAFVNSLMPTVSPENRKYLSTLANAQVLSNQKQYDNDIIDQNKATMTAMLLDNIRQAKQTMSDAIAKNPDIENNPVAQNAYARVVNLTENGVQNRLMDPGKSDQIKSSAQQDLYGGSILAKTAQLAQDTEHPDAYLQYKKSLVEKGVPGYEYPELQTLISKTDKLYDSLQQASAISTELWNKKVTTMIHNQENGIPYDETEFQNAKDSVPKRAPIYDFEMNEAKLVSSEAERIIGLKPEDRIKALADTTQTNGIDIGNRVSKQVNGFVKQMSEDQVAALKSHPAFTKALSNEVTAQLAQMQTDGSPNIPNQLTAANPIDTMRHIETMMGFPGDKVMDNPTALYYANKIATSDPKEVINTIKELQDKFGDNYQYAIKNVTSLKKSGLSAGAQYMGNIPTNMVKSDDLMAAMTMPAKVLEANIPLKDFNQLKSNIGAILASQSSVSPLPFMSLNNSQKLQNYVDQMKHISGLKNSSDQNVGLKDYLTRLSVAAYQTGMVSNLKDGLDFAAGTITDKFNFAKINGAPTMIPQTYKKSALSASDIENYANQQLPKILDKNKDGSYAFDVKVPGGLIDTSKGYLGFKNQDLSQDAQRQLYYKTYLSSGHWVMNDARDGMELRDAQNNPVVNTAGRHYGFTFDEMYASKLTGKKK